MGGVHVSYPLWTPMVYLHHHPRWVFKRLYLQRKTVLQFKTLIWGMFEGSCQTYIYAEAFVWIVCCRQNLRMSLVVVAATCEHFATWRYSYFYPSFVDWCQLSRLSYSYKFMTPYFKSVPRKSASRERFLSKPPAGRAGGVSNSNQPFLDPSYLPSPTPTYLLLSDAYYSIERVETVR